MDELDLTGQKNHHKYLIDSSKSQGDNELTKLYSWNFEESKICCYGWYDGAKGFENSHDLPHGGKSDFLDEDSSEIILYGDIFIVKYHYDKLIDITISDYSVFYSDRFENFCDYISDNEDVDDCNEIETNEICIEDTELNVSESTKTNDLDYDNYEY